MDGIAVGVSNAAGITKMEVDVGFTVIGLLGPAGSGKDLVADWFVNKGFVKVAFADPMKRFVQRAFGLSVEQLWGPSEERNKKFPVSLAWWFNAIGNMGKASEELVGSVLSEGTRAIGYLKLMEWFSWLRKTYPEEIAAREILQTLGTEWGREVDGLMWAKYAHRVAFGLLQGKYSYTQTGGLNPLELHLRAPAGVVIPDHRFVNEIATTQENDGYVLRLRRTALEPKTIGIDGHRSENEQKAVPDSAFDLVFEFPEGVDQVHAALEKAFEGQTWAIKRRSNRS